jgi:ATP-dependent exoDNAse (exonuclease V) alpha subunit
LERIFLDTYISAPGWSRASARWSEADELTLAYAISVHKAQSSEFPAVVLPVVTRTT